MMPLPTIALFLAAVQPPAQGTAQGQEWLILQTAADPLALVGAAAARRAPGARVIATDDCAGMRGGLFILVTRPGKGSRPAGAYVRRCVTQPHTATGRGIAAVDPSFAALRTTPVNFGGEDIVSYIRANLLVRPYYAPAPNDPREGLRVAVEDMLDGRRRPIVADCPGAEVMRGPNHIAIACADEQVAGQPIYRTTVYRADTLARLATVAKCRDPMFWRDDLLQCQAQTIAANGMVRLAPRTVRF